MILIAHRVNTVEQLERTPLAYGVEVDIRDRGADIVLQHDAFKDGEGLEDYLRHFRHRFLILNVKCEGIEEQAIRLARDRGIEDFFLLDATIPAMVKLGRRGERRFAVRFSEYEPVEACLALTSIGTWVWVDCFSDYPARPSAWEAVRERFRVCLVSPELHGRRPPGADSAAAICARFSADAVCTKRPEAWLAAGGAGSGPVAAGA
jgi:hypothetical protein